MENINNNKNNISNNEKNNGSPQKQRHNGTSPLPLGMDWSPPPKQWDGRYTVWPHDPCTGWSYCVMVPSWIAQPKPGVFTGHSLNAIVYFRVLVGIRSPEGISTSHVILRRFSDFLKLFSDVKRAFHRKIIPPAPPKNSLSHVNSSQLLLEERRCALEKWMGKLLSDIDLSRSTPIASFLELEAAVRSSHDINQHLSEASFSDDEIAKAALPLNGSPTSGSSVADSAGSSRLLSSPSEFGNANETSRQGNAHTSEFNTKDLVSEHALNPVRKSFYKGIHQEKSEEPLKSELQYEKENHVLENEFFCGNSSKGSTAYHVEIAAEKKQSKLFCHTLDLSVESIRRDICSTRGSELSNLSTSTSLGDGSANLLYGTEAPLGAFGSMELQCMNDVLVIHPVDNQHKLNKFLVTMHQRLVTAKTDMEELIARLNQEIAVKEYLKAKVRDLEVELESAKQKNKEDFQHAILLERERVTQIQWDIDELRRNYMVIESKLNVEKNERARAESESASFRGEKERLLQELSNKTKQLKDLQKHHEELEIKSKSDFRVLAKEVKLLRSSQAELKEVLNQSLKEKAVLERILQKDKQRRIQMKLTRKKLMYACEDIRHRLQESSVNFLAEKEDKFTVNPSSLSDALGLLTTSDVRIGVLLAKAQLIGQDDGHDIIDREATDDTTNDPRSESDDEMAIDDEIRKILSDAIIDGAILRKQINSIVRCALKTTIKPPKDKSGEAPSRKAALRIFFRKK